jgi:hypothetical protein
MKYYDENLEKILTAVFGVIGSLAIIINLFIKGWTNENILDGLVDFAGLIVTIIVFLVAFRTMTRLDYSGFKKEFEKYLQEWIDQNSYLIDEDKKTRMDRSK